MVKSGWLYYTRIDLIQNLGLYIYNSVTHDLPYDIVQGLNCLPCDQATALTYR